MTKRRKRVLIAGGEGQLGVQLRRTAPLWSEVTAPGRDVLDITRADAVERVVEDEDPDWIVNAAGYTDVDGAEEASERAFAVNGDGAAILARAVRDRSRTGDGVADEDGGCRMLHVSTDFVFDGESGRPYPPDAPPAPLSVYGRSKLEGERRVREILGPNALVVRTAWLYSARGSNFLRAMLRLLREREELRIVADQVGTPTRARGLAEALWAMMERELDGIHHWTDAGVASWYDFAVAIQEEGASLGLLDEGARIVPIPTEEYPTPARRPAYSVLDKSKTWRALGRVSPHWRVALREMLSGLTELRA